MNTNVEVLHGSPVPAIAGDSQRVLRNTYALLAVSMLPTVLGAWVGVQTGIASAMSPMIGLIVFMAGAFGFMFAIEKYKNSGLGVALLLGFTFFMGVMLSRLISVVLATSGPGVVMTAFGGTAAIFFTMATLSSVIKRDLSGMGKFLTIGALMLFVAMIANFFLQSSVLMIVLAILGMGIFSAFILYDLRQVRDGVETNYITATLSVYLSIYNVFQFMLALLGLGGSRDD